MSENHEAVAEVTGLFSNEALVQRRIELHYDLGRISANLCEAQKDYNACITDILRTSEELRARGVDTSEIERQLYQPARNEDTA